MTLSKSEYSIGLFETLKMFYPPKGLRKQNRRSSNCFYFTFYCVQERVFDVSKSAFSQAFLKNWKCFIPRRDSAKAEPEGGPIVFTYVLLCSRKGVWIFKIPIFTGLFENLKMFYLRMGWMDGMDGMDGWDGISKVSFNFLYIQICWQLRCGLSKYMFKVCHQLSYGFEILVSSWGWGSTIFEITIFTWLFKYLGPNLSFFFLFFCAFFHFDEKFKNLFYHAKLKKVGVTFFFVFYRTNPFFYENFKTRQYLSFGGGF